MVLTQMPGRAKAGFQSSPRGVRLVPCRYGLSFGIPVRKPRPRDSFLDSSFYFLLPFVFLWAHASLQTDAKVPELDAWNTLLLTKGWSCDPLSSKVNCGSKGI